jgi:Co/Zn/Cd efflux system component
VDTRWTPGNVLLWVLVALVAAAIFLSGWSFGDIVLALAVIVVVIAVLYGLARRHESRQR